MTLKLRQNLNWGNVVSSKGPRAHPWHVVAHKAGRHILHAVREGPPHAPAGDFQGDAVLASSELMYWAGLWRCFHLVVADPGRIPA